MLRIENGGRRVWRNRKGRSRVNSKRRVEMRDIIGVEGWHC